MQSNNHAFSVLVLYMHVLRWNVMFFILLWVYI
jgi:hypothetical protein